MTREQTLRRLAVQWAVGSATISCLVVAQAVLGKYGPNARDAIGWALTCLAPTLSLVTTAALSDSTTRWKAGTANLFRYRLAFWASLTYLAALLVLLLIEPFVPYSQFELFSLSDTFLGVWQALAVAAITSVIFDKR